MTFQRTLVLAVFATVVIGAPISAQERTELYPRPECGTGQLEVSDLHTIFYVTCGNPEGKPAMALHGGPGVGSYPRLAQYFNPEKYFIVLHDQRGAGQSQPKGELRENTTQHLVEDIEKLRKHLKLGKVVLFGGSWGSTLALTYAQTYPENVEAMILRGVFLASDEELEFHYLGNRFFFPKEYHALLDVLPDKSKGAGPDYLHQLVSGDDKKVALEVGRALATYELKFMKLHMPDDLVSSYVDSMVESGDKSAQSIDLHYVSNRHFLEKDQILNNMDMIKEIPATIINGRYDMAAPPLSAFRVHKELPKSKLVIVEEAGHSESEEGITAALMKACAEFE
jgi:proline iminopeptidase